MNEEVVPKDFYEKWPIKSKKIRVKNQPESGVVYDKSY